MKRSHVFLHLLLSLLPALVSAPLLATETTRIPGKFVWADLVTHDASRAQAFYHAWLGWEFKPADDLQLILHGGRTLGALRQRARPANSTARARWIGYVSVQSVETAAQRVTAAGGKTLLATQRSTTLGDHALMADAEDALFGLIHRPDSDPEDYLAEPGEWIWMQLLTRDPHKAVTFYQQVGDYDPYPLNEGGSRQLLVKDGYARAALSLLPADKPEIAPAWLPFLRVENITAALTQVKSLGGEILLAPAPERMNGQVAIVADPTGAAVGVLEWHGEENGEVAP